MEQTQKGWAAKARTLPRRLLAGRIAEVDNKYKQLKNRYGTGYTTAMLIAVSMTFLLPLPGITMASVAPIVLIAEAQRAISLRRRLARDHCQSGGYGID